MLIDDTIVNETHFTVTELMSPACLRMHCAIIGRRPGSRALQPLSHAGEYLYGPLEHQSRFDLLTQQKIEPDHLSCFLPRTFCKVHGSYVYRNSYPVAGHFHTRRSFVSVVSPYTDDTYFR